MKKSTTLVLVFLVSFTLNFIWEEAHSVLYLHYKGDEITHLTLLRAALFDACFTTALVSPLIYFGFTKKRYWALIAAAFFFAIFLELFALSTFRWAYTEKMPIIPFVGTGLTPTIQLALLAHITYSVLGIWRVGR